MAASRNQFRAAIVPSLAILIFQTASLVCADSILFGSPRGMVVSALLYAAAACTAIAVLYKKLPRDASCTTHRARTIKFTVVFLCAIIAVCILPFIRSARAPYPGTTAEITRMRVISVSEKRYCDELVVETRCPDGMHPERGLVVHEGASTVSAGDIIAVKSKLTPLIAGPHTSGFNARQVRRGMSFIAYADRESVTVLGKRGSEIRDAARQRIVRLSDGLFTPDTSSFVKALLLGNQNHVSKKTVSEFRRAGVLHILAASGTHVAILASIPLVLLGLARVDRRVILATATAMVWCYLFITDMPVSLARSCVMFTAFALQYIFALGRNPLNTLFLSGAAVLLAWPYELFELGFQLSFGATLGIMLLYQPYRKALPGMGGKNHLASSVSLTLAAQAAVMPVILGRLGEINVISVVSNIAVVPVVTVIFYASLFTLGLSPVSMPIAAHAGAVCDRLYGLLGFVTAKLSCMNGHFYVTGPWWPLFIAYALLLVPLLPAVKKKSAAVISVLAAHALAVAMLAPVESTTGQPLSIRGGKGKAILAREGDILCLVGSISEPEASDRAIAEIERTAYRSLVVYMTSADYKNIRQFTRIVKKCCVSEIRIPESVSFSAGFMSLCRAAQRDGTRMVLHGENRKVLKNYTDDGMIARALDQYREFVNSEDKPVYRIIRGRDYSDNMGDINQECKPGQHPPDAEQRQNTP